MGPRGLARFEASLDPQWVEQALAFTGKASIRRRKLPADQVVWLIVGMALFRDRSIVNVVEHLDLVAPGVESLAPSAIPQSDAGIAEEGHCGTGATRARTCPGCPSSWSQQGTQIGARSTRTACYTPVSRFT